MPDPKQHEDGLRADIKAYSALKSINKSVELDAFMDLLLKTAAMKMQWAFVGDNVKTWEDFLKVRGEIVSYLYPIQEVRGADAMINHLNEQLKEIYKNPYN